MSQVNVILSSKSIKIEPVVITDDKMPIAHAYGSVSDIQPLKRNDEWILVVSFSDPDKSSINLKLSSIANQPTWTDDQAGALQAYNDISVNFKSATGGSVATGWQRPSTWVEVPAITRTDNVMYGVYAVYEPSANQINLATIYSDQTVNVDWGNGVVENNKIGYEIAYLYDYNTVTSAITVDEYGYNYKTVLVKITLANPSAETVWQASLEGYDPIVVPTFTYYTQMWLEMSWATEKTGNKRIGKISQLLMSLQSLSLDMPSTNLSFNGLTNLQRLNIAPTLLTTPGLTIIESGGPGFNIDYINTSTTATFNVQLGGVNDIGNIDFPNSTASFQYILRGTGSAGTQRNHFLRTVGNISLGVATNISGMFVDQYFLRKVGVINAPNVTTISGLFHNNYSLKEVVFTDCSKVTVTDAFNNLNWSLTKVIMPGLRYGIILINTPMTATALNEFMTSLGTAINGSQTINIGGNVGSTTCDPTIATAKGFTVIV